MAVGYGVCVSLCDATGRMDSKCTADIDYIYSGSAQNPLEECGKVMSRSAAPAGPVQKTDTKRLILGRRALSEKSKVARE